MKQTGEAARPIWTPSQYYNSHFLSTADTFEAPPTQIISAEQKCVPYYSPILLCQEQNKNSSHQEFSGSALLVFLRQLGGQRIGAYRYGSVPPTVARFCFFNATPCT